MHSLYPSRYAFLRPPTSSVVNGLTQNPNHPKPDPEEFKAQYNAYVAALVSMGLEVSLCAPDDRFPDGNFVEDTHLILDGKILIELNPGAPSRAGEPISLREFLPSDLTKHMLSKAFTIDGGDILDDRRTLYVGLSKRTQQGAIDELTQLVAQYDYRVRALPVPEGLHLKSGMTCFLPGHFVIQQSFEGIAKMLQAEDPSVHYFVVPPEEDFAANVLPINGKIMIPTGCPKTRAHIEQFYSSDNIVEVDTSQARLIDGALTCSSLLI